MRISRTLLTISLLVTGLFFTEGLSQPVRRSSVKDVDARVEALLSKMTVEEKVGQMTQLTIDVVSVGPDGRTEPHAIDAKKLENAILKYHVGSIINVGPQFYSVSHWHEVIRQIQDVAKRTRLAIPVLYGIDAIHGATYTKGSTLFPQPLGMASTWNRDLARNIGAITSYEVRASGIPWNFYPVLDIGRQPLWPRLWETLGEDVYLGTQISGAYIVGAQGEDVSARDKLALCLKHYAGYSLPVSGRDRTPAWIDERMMREYVLPAFEAAVKAGVPSVMVNSAEVNGIPGHANYHLLTEVLKGEWKFEGLVVSDWADIDRLYSRDKVAATPKEAVRMSVMAGVDMSMVPLDLSFYDHLLALAKEGGVPMTRIDDAVRRILRVKFQVGLFERPTADESMAAGFATKENTTVNQQAAAESIVLLKNDKSVLPLAANARVLVTGPTADLLSALNSGWTITWQGDQENLYPSDKPTILEAIRGRLGADHVSYVPGSSFDSLLDVNAAQKAAENVDVIVACLGEPAYCETPGNISDLTLNKAQLSLVEALAGTGKPVILVLAQGRPRIIHDIVDDAKAIVVGFLPGMEGGKAIADVLFGAANPSGKLPVTYPKYPNALTPYDCKVNEVVDGNAYDPEYPFGFGLSYTTFAYDALTVSAEKAGMNEPVRVGVRVTNTGKREGMEVVQLYVADLVRSVTPQVRQLKGFEKVSLKPGESKTVTFTLRSEDLSFIGLDNKRTTEPGMFTVSVGGLKRSFELQ